MKWFDSLSQFTENNWISDQFDAIYSRMSIICVTKVTTDCGLGVCLIDCSDCTCLSNGAVLYQLKFNVYLTCLCFHSNDAVDKTVK